LEQVVQRAALHTSAVLGRTSVIVIWDDGVRTKGTVATMLTLAFELERDPLRVLETTRLVVEAARSVRIVPEKIDEVAALLVDTPAAAPDWADNGHPVGADEHQRANLVLVVNALNFCFWSVPSARRPRWKVTDRGTTHDGYWALVAALRRAVEAGRPLWDAKYLAALAGPDIAAILAGDQGCEDIRLLHARLQHLQEVGDALLAHWDGSFLQAVTAAHHSAPALVRAVLHQLPSFRDTAPWDRHDVRFYKRAQILVADLHAAFNGAGPGAFHDLDLLTAFADYKLPQLLRHHGVLEYTPDLAASIAAYHLVPPDSDEELEIRAATVWSVELLRQTLTAHGHALPAHQIDWALWRAAQTLPADAEPYHRTLTVYY
jgi:hypothetical protein